MFQAIADAIGFPVDQIRYIMLMFMSYPLAYVFRYALHPSHTSLLVRYIFSISLGVLFGWLCFGMQMFILFGVVLVCYAMLFLLPASKVQRYTMAWAMASMSAAHYYRLMTDYGGWTLDFTGPLMVIVQKVTLVAYALHDGKSRKDSELNDDQRAQKIDECPSPIEYFTYIFNFHSLLAGPSFTIKEFLAFMDGSNLKPLDNPNQFAKAKQHIGEPSALYPILYKLVFSLVSMGLFVTLGMHFKQEMLLDPQYNVLTRLYILFIYCFKVRTRYFFVWLLGDSINNTCGIGFNGYDKMGYPKWDLVTNVLALNVELSSNIRSVVTNWNITTASWLRRVCYERVTVSPTVLTYTLSAWWHGFYPGYYLSFIMVAVVTEAARKMRRLVRPHFQGSLALKWFYDVVTWAITIFYLNYMIIPFDLMWLPEGHLFWSYGYYIPHIIVLVIMFLFPSGKSHKPKKEVSANGEPAAQEGEKAKTD